MAEQTIVEAGKQGFAVASFGADGVLEGTGQWSVDALSKEWIDLCAMYLKQNGDDFDAPWSGNLSHIRTKFTTSQGVALVSFSAHGELVASVALARGTSIPAESSVLAMFVSSLRQTELVRLSAQTSEPFKEVLSVSDRPLMVVVPWGSPRVPEQDHRLVQELALHLAAAFFQ